MASVPTGTPAGICAAGARDDDLQPAAARGLRVVVQALRRPVRGDDLRLVGDLQLIEDLRRLLQRGPIRLTSHDDADDGFAGAHCSCCTGPRKESGGLQEQGAQHKGFRASGEGSKAGSGGQKLVLDRGDAILDRELLLFQALDEELVGGCRAFEQDDLVVKLAVLRPELDEFVTELSFVDTLHTPARLAPC